MKVTNINGTSDNNCKCESWLEHWKNHGGGTVPKFCPEKSCILPPAVGAHVQKDSGSDNSWYIIPLCSKHNRMKGESLDVSDYTTLVSASVSQTCGKNVSLSRW